MNRTIRIILITIVGVHFSGSSIHAEDLPALQMFVPGFKVEKLPVTITNLVNLEYASDGRLFAAGYDGRIFQLKDTNGDGLEDEAFVIHDKKSDDYPLGFAVHRDGVYVLNKNELVKYIDTNNDGTPDKREIVLSNWDDAELLKHPLILKRRVDFAMGLAIGPDGSIYIGMGNAAYNNAYMIDKEGKAGEKNQSHYKPSNLRGCVLKFSADGKKKEQFVTGTRYLMCMQFNREGDLFATDQEGATWLPNGNPLMSYFISNKAGIMDFLHDILHIYQMLLMSQAFSIMPLSTRVCAASDLIKIQFLVPHGGKTMP